jgi:hypothetical protein
MVSAPRYLVLFVCVLTLLSASLLSARSATPEQGPYPRHVDLATLGTVLGMRGQTASENGLPVRLSSGVAMQLVEADFRYESFFLQQILINKYATINGQPGSWRVQGMLVFEDVAGRRAYAQYSTYYRVLDDGIEITRAAARALTPTKPTVVWFALRQENLPTGVLTPENHAELIKLAATQSLTTVPSDVDSYVIFAMSMDRFADSEQMTFESDISGVETTLVNLGGWPVGIFTGRLDPDDVDGALAANLEGNIFASDKIVLEKFPTRPFEWDGAEQ